MMEHPECLGVQAQQTIRTSVDQRIVEAQSYKERDDVSTVVSKIEMDRMRLYAWFYVLAERRNRRFEGDLEHTRRAIAEICGALYGFDDGYNDPDRAEETYRGGRKTMNHIHLLSCKAIKALENLQSKMLQPGGPVSVPFARSFGLKLSQLEESRLATTTGEGPYRIGDALDIIYAIANRSACKGDRFESEKALERARRSDIGTLQQDVLRQWYFRIDAYKNKWLDMWALAYSWGISEAEDVEHLRRKTLLLTQGVTKVWRYPPPPPPL